MAQGRTILLGRITKVHGHEGAVALKLEKNFFEEIPHLESVFLEIDGRPVPFFIDSFDHVRTDTAYIRFQDYDTIEKIREFCGSRVYLATDQVPAREDVMNSDIDGYRVLSEDNQLMGIVEETIKNQSQWLLRVVSSDGKEFLLPLHEDLIIALDEDAGSVTMIIPEGLRDI